MAVIADDRTEPEPDPRPESVTRPSSPLAGPEGHPFHPMLVTVPIGAWVSSLVFDVGNRISDDPVTFGRGAMWLILIGVGSAAVAAVFGLLDLRTVPTGTPARATARAHLSLNAVALVLWTGNAWARNEAWEPPFEVPWWAIGWSVVALAITGASGYLGGRLAYHYGVRVAGARKLAEGFEPAAEEPQLPGI